MQYLLVVVVVGGGGVVVGGAALIMDQNGWHCELNKVMMNALQRKGMYDDNWRVNIQVGNFVGFFDGDGVGLPVVGAEVVGGAALIIR